MIGDLKYRVTIEEEARTADGGGGFTAVWQSVAECPDVYAAIMPLGGSESLRDHQLQTEATHKIIIRWRGDVTPANRIVKEGAVYDIISLRDPTGSASYLEILSARRNPEL